MPRQRGTCQPGTPQPGTPQRGTRPDADGRAALRRASARSGSRKWAEAIEADTRLTEVSSPAPGRSLGALQIFALLPGISRDGVVMVGGMFRGLSRQDAARVSFLLSAPVILAAGALKLGELTGPDSASIGGQVLAGSIASGVSAFLALRFLMRYLQRQKRHADAVRDLLPGGRHRQRHLPVRAVGGFLTGSVRQSRPRVQAS